MERPISFLCITCFFKGKNFMKALKAAGNTVYLVTKKSLEHADWPREALDDIFFLDNDANTPENLHNLSLGLAHLMRSRKIDRIVALDDFDVEKAAYLREEFRIPGMGSTTARYFRDKLAMRIQAQDAGIPVPAFSSLFHDDDIHHYTRNVPAPWLVKPRGEASATGIKKIASAEELWPVLESLGEDRHRFLIESFKPGDVYHADALFLNGESLFCRTSRYLTPPFDVAHGGGVFRSMTVDFDSPEDLALKDLTNKVMKAFGMRSSASHTEFIRSRETGEFYFLETSSRVGGAHLSDMVERSSGIDLWSEWAKLEDALAKGKPFQLPTPRNDYAGVLITLARQEFPDMAPFSAPEVVWHLQKKFHVGFIVQSPNKNRILELLDQYLEMVYRDYHTSAPVPDHPTD
ncbi:MAG: ATPase [Lewinellaceae bacterium]|nr:ATPase [Lewinellaceae bacterium]